MTIKADALLDTVLANIDGVYMKRDATREDVWCRFLSEILARLITGDDDKRIKEEEENVCAICLDQRADTLAIPCMHVCVCRACSKRLKTSNTCVQCRRPITGVLEDEAAAEADPSRK